MPPVFEKKMLVPTLVTDSPIFKIIPRSWLVSLINLLMYKSKIATKSFNQIAKRYGVKPFHSMEELMMGDTIIVTDVPEILTISKLELESWQPSTKDKKFYSYGYKLRYGGAIFAKLFGDIPEEVITFLKSDLPKIYVALTSGRSEVLERVYDAGIPILGIPLHVEQGLNVAMIERHGAGLLQIKHRINPQEIKDKVLKILNDSSFKKNMEQLSTYQKQVDGVSRTVDIILEKY